MTHVSEELALIDQLREQQVSSRPSPEQVAMWWADLHGRLRAPKREAREALITHYAPLVTQIASRMIGRLPDQVELGDLVSYGMFGLIDAVEKFEPERGFKFETYAGTRIRGAIIDELRAADWVPRSLRTKARAVDNATRELEQELLRPVRDEDVARHLEWDTSDVRTVRAQVALSHIGALDAIGHDNESRSCDALAALAVPGAQCSVEAVEARSLLAGAIQGVRDRERQVLTLYYYENLTLSQIGQVLGVTESRVSQIHSAAVKKLRSVLMETGAFGPH